MPQESVPAEVCQRSPSLFELAFHGREPFWLDRSQLHPATSNHVHLLVYDSDGGEAVARGIVLSAGRTAQQYNRRKNRKGAFWEDRHHASAIRTGNHLGRCLVYMDLNMAWAGVVKHPSELPHGGYTVIQCPPRRYGIIRRVALMHLLGISDSERLSQAHCAWVEEALKARERVREKSSRMGRAMNSDKCRFLIMAILTRKMPPKLRKHAFLAGL